MSRIACLVQCASSKRQNRDQSWALYNSVNFQKAWTAASLLGDPYVMSAKHGLVSATERLDPYDEYLGDKSADKKRAWAIDVVETLPDHYDGIVLFGGRDYVEPVKDCIDLETQYNWWFDVYADTSGNGKQMAVCDDISEAVIDGELGYSGPRTDYEELHELV